jgi:N6-L-threonylcarbamoyladenine synthase
VAIVDDSRRVLSSRRVSFVESQRQLLGISPYASAYQHRANIDRLVDECVKEANVRISDLDAIAGTTTPGLVLCLKVGVDKALGMCR